MSKGDSGAYADNPYADAAIVPVPMGDAHDPAPGTPPSYGAAPVTGVAVGGLASKTGVVYGGAGDVGDLPFPPSPQGDRSLAPTVYRDVAYIGAFVAHLVVFFIVLGVYAHSFHPKDPGAVFDDQHETETWIRIMVVVTLMAMAMSAVWMLIIRKFAAGLIWTMLVVNTGMTVVLMIQFFAMGQAGLGVLFIFLALLSLWYFWYARRFIPFSTAMLKTVVTIIEAFPRTVLVGYGFMVLQFAWVLLWAYAVLATLSHTATNARNAALLYLLFSNYWVSQVLKNVVHVTASGTVGTWYFAQGHMPADPTTGALRRALTTSFGSICLGSLLVAILKTIRYMLRASMEQSRGVGRVIIMCLVDFIERMVEYFNVYAFVQVALYGKKYMDAAKATFQLVKTHFVDALINDDLISSVLVMACFIGGCVCALVGAVWAHVEDMDNWPLVSFFAFIVGFMVIAIPMQVVQSAVVTVFVGFAEDPGALRIQNPALYTHFVTAWRAKSGVNDPNVRV